MSTTTETGFYTLHGTENDPGTLTACAPCALANTNPVLAAHGIAPASSMAEAALVLHTQLALAGGDPDHLLTYHEHGTCEFCGKEA